MDKKEKQKNKKAIFGVMGIMFLLLFSGVVTSTYETNGFWDLIDNDTITLKDDNHNVNIGSNETTIYKFDVNGTSRFRDTMYLESNKRFYFGPTSGDAWVSQNSEGILYQLGGADNYTIVGYGDANFVWKTGYPVATEKFMINEDGNIIVDGTSQFNNDMLINKDIYSNQSHKGMSTSFQDKDGNTYTVENGLIVDVMPFFCNFLIHLQIPTNHTTVSKITGISQCLGANIEVRYNDSKPLINETDVLGVYNATISSSSYLYYDFEFNLSVPNDLLEITINILGFTSARLMSIDHNNFSELYINWTTGKTIQVGDSDYSKILTSNDIISIIDIINNYLPPDNN